MRVPVFFDSEPEFRKMLKISFLLHIVFFTIITFSFSTNRRSYTTGVYRVSLRSLPVAQGHEGPVAEKQAARPLQKNQQKQVNIPVAKTAPTNKKKKTITTEKQKRAAKKTEDKKTGEKPAESEDIYALLKGARKELSAIDPGRTQSAVGAGTSGSAATGAMLSGAARTYYDEVEKRIKNSWVLPGEMVEQAKKLKTVIGIRISRNGNIEKIWLEQESGNLYYDKAALRAVNKANPLPPLPAEMPDKTLEIGIIF